MKIAFIHSSAGPNNLHKKYALSLGADLVKEDRVINLYQKPASKLKLILGWMINAISLGTLKKSDVIITDSFRVSVTIAKVLGILKPRQKIILFFGSEQLIKLKKKHYSKSLSFLYNLSLKNADAFLNLGIVNQELTTKYYKDVPSIMLFNGVESEKMNSLLSVRPAIDKNIFFVMANVLSVRRARIKGVDIALKAFKIFKEQTKVDAKLIIAGEISGEVMQYFSENFDPVYLETIVFRGKVEDLPKFFSECTFGLNLSRYDAWSLVVNESLLAGIPCLVSENTGSLGMAEQVNENMTVSEDINEIVSRIFWLFNLNHVERYDLSEKGRNISKTYTEVRAIEAFQLAFKQLINE